MHDRLEKHVEGKLKSTHVRKKDVKMFWLPYGKYSIASNFSFDEIYAHISHIRSADSSYSIN